MPNGVKFIDTKRTFSIIILLRLYVFLSFIYAIVREIVNILYFLYTYVFLNPSLKIS